IAINTPVNRITAKRRGGRDNGNYIVWWDATLASGRKESGFCETNPLTGRVVRLATDQKDMSGVNRTYRITPEDAGRICQREARERFSPGNGELEATFKRNVSTKDTYRLEWRYDSLAWTIRKGHCEIDSATGLVRKFDANNGW